MDEHSGRAMESFAACLSIALAVYDEELSTNGRSQS